MDTPSHDKDSERGPDKECPVTWTERKKMYLYLAFGYD